MGQIKSWTVSDELWEKVSTLIPERKREKGKKYRRKPGGGRKALDMRRVFEGIIYVLRTGCQWKALPEERFGSASSVHKYFLEWKEAGFFVRLWRKGLAEYSDLEKIAWAWQSIDGAVVKAPLAQEEVGANPTDRGKKRYQEKPAGRRAWNPVVDSRSRSQPARRPTAGGNPEAGGAPEEGTDKRPSVR